MFFLSIIIVVESLPAKQYLIVTAALCVLPNKTETLNVAMKGWEGEKRENQVEPTWFCGNHDVVDNGLILAALGRRIKLDLKGNVETYKNKRVSR